MALVNLTQHYLDKCNASLFERIRFHFKPDAYWASSLSSLEEFEEEPPLKYSFAHESEHAFVILENIGVRINHNCHFDEKKWDCKWLFGNALTTPYFDLADGTSSRIATWNAGSFRDYIRIKDYFEFSKRQFVPAGEIYLHYIHSSNNGLLELIHFGDYKEPAPEGFFEKLSSLIPELKSAEGRYNFTCAHFPRELKAPFGNAGNPAAFLMRFKYYFRSHCWVLQLL